MMLDLTHPHLRDCLAGQHSGAWPGIQPLSSERMDGPFAFALPGLKLYDINEA